LGPWARGANVRPRFHNCVFADNRKEQPRMPGKGRPFPKGVSGNPGGRPKRDPEVRALCEKFTPDAIETLAEIMQDKDSQPSARVSAAMAILKKTLPDLASIEHTGDGPRPFAVIPEAVESGAEWEAKFRPKTEH
jgi:hypothetical protein